MPTTTPTGASPYGAVPPGGMPPGAVPPGAAPAGTPPQGGGGKGTKIAIIVLIVAIVAGLGIGAVLLLGSSGDDDEDVATERSTTTTTEDEETDETTEDEDEDSSTRRTLVERTTTSESDEPDETIVEDGDLGGELESALGYDLDPAVLSCAGEAILADDALTQATQSGDMDPASPEFAALLDILLGCGARPALEDAFVEGMAEGGMTQPQIDCVSGILAGLDDQQFADAITGFATQDPAAIDMITGCMV